MLHARAEQPRGPGGVYVDRAGVILELGIPSTRVAAGWQSCHTSGMR